MAAHVLAVARTPVARLDGGLADRHPVELLAAVLMAVAERADLGTELPAEVLAATLTPAGAQGGNIARAAALVAGWDTVPGTTLDAGAAGGHRALLAAADVVASGRAEVVVAAGVEVSSVVSPGAIALGDRFGKPWGRALADRFTTDGGLAGPLEVADRHARHHGIDAERQAAWAMAARRRASALADPRLVAVGRCTQDEPVAEPDPGSHLLEPGATTAVVAPPADAAVAAAVVSSDWLSARGRRADLIVGESRHLAVRPFGDPAPAALLAMPSIDRSTVAVVDDRSAPWCLAVIDELGLDPASVNPAGGRLGRGDAGGAAYLVELGATLTAAPGAGTILTVTTDDLGTVLATVFRRS